VKKKLRFLKGVIRSRLTRRLLGPHAYAIVAKAENGLFAVDPEDNVVGGGLRRKGRYGLDEIARLVPRLGPDSRLLVVGAHLGTLAIPLARHCREVVAIEANPATYALLSLNVALNRASNIRTLEVAASDKEEEIEFLMSTENSGGSKRVPKVKEFMYYYDDPVQTTVEAVRLDTYLDDTKFDVVVMDIEGSEYFALRGMQEILSGCSALVVEFLPHHLRNVSGVSVEAFLSVIEPHFSRLTIPSSGLVVDAPKFAETLNRMYDLEQGDDGIIFEKV